MRKTASFLNQLRLDVDTIQTEIDEVGCDIEAAAQKLAQYSVHDLATNNNEVEEAFIVLNSAHRSLGKLLTSFKKARTNYLEFF